MATPSDIFLPETLPYPIKIVSLLVHPPAEVRRGTRLLTYSFLHKTVASAPTLAPQTSFGTWESSVEGALHQWNVKLHETVELKRATERPVLLLNEPCKHGQQIGGLCALCGKDVTGFDYSGYSDSSRASIQMTHSATGPTVSLEEARRIERETSERMLLARKLSLIVDLDQTIVHATVDPTVGEWIAEGEAWEKRRAHRATEDEPGTLDDATADEVNPNWEALKDVRKFRLANETFGVPLRRQRASGRGKEKDESDGALYYIKPRPGLAEFLAQLATKYEMHVYTMGTRAYAEEVCAAIDSDGRVFGGRILSRDESGSLTFKSLQRLFPCDTSMVVIIDDRADVWEWSPNLVKVIPYDFFVGIGDINSSFLPPKVDPLLTVPSMNPRGSDLPPGPPRTLAVMPSKSGNGPAANGAAAVSEADSNEIDAAVLLTKQSQAISAQLEERPLAKKQEDLDHADHPINGDPGTAAKPVNGTGDASSHHIHKALLKNEDGELERVGAILADVHRQFFGKYDARPPASSQSRLSARETAQYDVRSIIPSMKTATFAGMHMMFSSVIPLEVAPETSDVWRMARQFGATCYSELSPRLTHVVTAKRSTAKVDAARRRGGAKIVWMEWFTHSIALWQAQDEQRYLVDTPAASPSANVPMASKRLLDESAGSAPAENVYAQAESTTDDGLNAGQEPEPELETIDVDWDEINREVDDAMNETDAEDDDPQADETGSGVGSSSAPSTPMRRHKRMRSMTPSDIRGSQRDGEVLTPAKRLKLSVHRRGASHLKQEISAATLADDDEPVSASTASQQALPDDSMVEFPSREAGGEEDGEWDDEDENATDDDFDEDNDFLARELGGLG